MKQSAKSWGEGGVERRGAGEGLASAASLPLLTIEVRVNTADVHIASLSRNLTVKSTKKMM